MASIKGILDTKENHGKVSLVAYLAAEDRSVIQTRLKKSVSIINKNEVAANEDSDMVKITFWAIRISDISLDGVYKVKNASMKEYNDISR